MTMYTFLPITRMSVVRSIAFALILVGGLATPSNGISKGLELRKGDRIAIVGDSITEQKKYSRFMELYLLACVPELELTMYQFGWGGERASGFANRMENDMVPWQPTVVTTCYGMNDGCYLPYTAQIGSAYEEGSRRIQSRCKELGIRMVVGGPSPVDTQVWNKAVPDADLYYNDNLSQLSGIAKRLAAENGFAYAGLHPLMMKVMQDAKVARGVDYSVCGNHDGVHPDGNGHLVIAYAFLKAMGMDGNIGTITVDMRTGAATATQGHRILSAINGTVEIESARYPFCFYGSETDSSGTRSILPFLPFNHDLNRYMLVVKNLSKRYADVTWGTETKTFSRGVLSVGINLADEFVDNPFSEPFSRLERVVADKQNRETRTIKGIITNIPGLVGDTPKDREIEDMAAELKQKLLERNAQDADRVRAAVKPVIHIIQIVPK